MEGPRAPLDSEFGSVIQFLDQNLRPQDGWSIAKEYPVAMSPQNIGNIRIIKEGDNVVSHAVMRPMIIKSPVGLFKIAGIGSVITSNDHRNQGLSRQILESCLSAARDHGCDFAILWTSLYDFYRKLGFELAGGETSLIFEKELKIEKPTYKILESNRVDPQAILRLFSSHSVISLRTVEEVRQYLQIPNSHVYTAWDVDGSLKAYAIEGKGADLKGYVHEWGGSVNALAELIAHIRRVQGQPITVIAPKHTQNFLRRMEEFKPLFNHGYLGMVKILNPGHLFMKIKKYARYQGYHDFVLEKQGDKFYIGSGQEVFMTDSEADIVRLIFGPHTPGEIHPFDPATLTVLEKVLPIPFWIWGWDSI